MPRQPQTSELRRRMPPSQPSDSALSNPSESEAPPTPPAAGQDDDHTTVEHVHIVEHIDKPKTRKRRSTAIFLLGSLFGLVAAGFFAKSNDLIDFPELGEFSVDSLFDALPAGLVTDMRDLVVCLPCSSLFNTLHSSIRAFFDTLHSSIHCKSKSLVLTLRPTERRT